MPILQCRADCWTMNTTGGTSTTCQDCGKVFSEANAFKRHFRQYHKKSESDCHICERKFYTEFLLKHHIGLQHTNANCEICDKVVLKSSLNAHKKIHQENAFKCESCDKVYNRKNNLENHRKTCGRLVRVLRKEVTDIFNCDECHKTFTKKAYLNQLQSWQCLIKFH